MELVVFIPALCRKMGVPYVITKGRACLGYGGPQEDLRCRCYPGSQERRPTSLRHHRQRRQG